MLLAVSHFSFDYVVGFSFDQRAVSHLIMLLVSHLISGQFLI